MSATEHRAVPARVDPRFKGGMAATATIDVRGLADAASRPASPGRCASTLSHKAMYATDASNYRQVPIGVVIPKTLDDVVATHRVCHGFGAPDRQPRRRHQPVRRDGQLRRGHRPLQVPDRRSATSTPRPTAVTCRARARSTSSSTGRPGDRRPGLRARPVPALALRDRRQHRATTRAGSIPCRRSCTAPGRAPRTTSTRWRSSPTTAPASGWATARKTSSIRSSPRAAARARSTPGCVTCGTATPSSIRERYPPVDRLPRRVSGLQPRRAAARRSGFNVARALVGTESTCATVAPVNAETDPGAADADARRRGLRRRSPTPPSTSRRSSSAGSRSVSRRSTTG